MQCTCTYVWQDHNDMHACVCTEFSPHVSLWATHTRVDHLHLLSSLKMPVEKCHIRFRGGSDVPECMWWTWICLGFPHIHSGVSVPPSLDVGKYYCKLMSTHLWEEWSPAGPSITLDEPLHFPFVSQKKNKSKSRDSYIVRGAQNKTKW